VSLFHLTLESEWARGQRDGRYTPRRFADDGFVHCVGDRSTAAQIHAAYFADAKEPVLLVELDEARLDVEVKWEAPAPPDGRVHAHHAPAKTFPHVYGSLPMSAVVSVTVWR
jgi:uncharacterized protein (DUF952 family)